MELIKRRISLEDSTDRKNPKTWGTLSADTFYINFSLNQTIDDMGLFVDEEFIKKDVAHSVVDYSPLVDKLNKLGVWFDFMGGAKAQDVDYLVNKTDGATLRLPSKVESDYYDYGNNILTGSTDSKLQDVRSYARNDPFRVLFNTKTQIYSNYKGEIINGVDRIKSNGNPIKYVFDTPDDINLGTINQRHGIQYKDYTDTNTTNFSFITEGLNSTNTSLSALMKEEYLFGIVFAPEVQSEVFIERGKTSVMESHLRLSEIKNLDQLERYGNGRYKLVRN